MLVFAIYCQSSGTNETNINFRRLNVEFLVCKNDNLWYFLKVKCKKCVRIERWLIRSKTNNFCLLKLPLISTKCKKVQKIDSQTNFYLIHLLFYQLENLQPEFYDKKYDHFDE